jgi:hypothetical protein
MALLMAGPTIGYDTLDHPKVIVIAIYETMGYADLLEAAVHDQPADRTPAL